MTVDAVSPSRCVGCHACFNICPVRAITMVEMRKALNFRRLTSKPVLTAANVRKSVRH